ncbi:hypothetical protein PHACT_10330 [Pseudohongiella acticola]|uniref:RanBP2-type domain-containing protein n=1 Tax=Pseudohongiella acticola TaxID=1524254 RepID=A0A1E8CLY3_9GAMM|nr:DUF2007 domain-containing protein [Pseudohongiella acticola]OFE13486.1 hypothetical protein PHACT_10330 [Pseudohongiella acticola]
MKQIYTHENIVILHSVRNILAMNDIESFVKNEHTIPAGARHGINNIFHELWILNDQDYDKAAALIDTEIENPIVRDPWVCGDCNEENEGSFDVCWKCQSVPA